MKCPKCEHNHPARDGRVCSGAGCTYVFTFSPKDVETLHMTDGRFLSAIRSASQNDTAYFTKNQLYAAYARKQTFPRIAFFGFAFVCFLFSLLFLLTGEPLTGWIALGLAFSVTLFGMFGEPRIHKHSSFMKMIDRWDLDGKPIEKLIRQPSLSEPPPKWTEDDIYDYGFERLLIVQHDILVDLLVLNDVHAQQRALVISESGYPSYLMPHAHRVLHENPGIPVFILHDATREGVAMHRRVMEMNLPIVDRTIVDLGMTKESFRKLKRTKHFEPKNRSRELPVDALATPFLVTGLAACFATDATMAMLIEQHAREAAIASASSSFG